LRIENKHQDSKMQSQGLQPIYGVDPNTDITLTLKVSEYNHLVESEKMRENRRQYSRKQYQTQKQPKQPLFQNPQIQIAPVYVPSPAPVIRSDYPNYQNVSMYTTNPSVTNSPI
jgi:hypothetical protein